MERSGELSILASELILTLEKTYLQLDKLQLEVCHLSHPSIAPLQFLRREIILSIPTNFKVLYFI